ncbi:hypothetical protein BDY24DRAFT_339718 [Mrakia frigida]|uniref:uncharacterized protein n=1 Tax=Mrakia frigida TaxID=29902 RepID=UPI003FCBF0DB
MSAYSHARTASDLNTQVLLGLPDQAHNPPPSPGLDARGGFEVRGGKEDGNVVWERKMGPAETSYWLPSRAEGVNDMYLHLKLLAPTSLFLPSRVLLVWALLRIRHPLIGSVVEERGVDDIYFVHRLPKSTSEAIIAAKKAATFPTGRTKAELVDAYLNGPRTLSADLLCKIVISIPPPLPAAPNGVVGHNTNFDFMFLAGHFLADGVSFAVIANEFLTLLASDMNEEDLSNLVQSEIDARVLIGANPIPVSTEQRLAIPRSWGKFHRAIGQVEFMNNQAKQIGGQTFPRAPPGAERRTHVDTVTYDPKVTATILKKCKSEGITIAHAVFALVNMAWARNKDPQNNLPLMLYSAINLRGALRPPKPAASSFFHLCVGYYNVVLPSFLIPTLTDSQTFWLRCQSTKLQTFKAVKSKFLVTRAMAMSIMRQRQAVGWAMQDDAAAKAKKLGNGNGNGNGNVNGGGVGAAAPKAPQAPQTALMGVSFLGNLDAISNYTTYTSIHTSDLTFGARQRPGGMLMFAYTFAGRLWFSLGWDVNGYPEGVVEEFWKDFNAGVGEFLNVR